MPIVGRDLLNAASNYSHLHFKKLQPFFLTAVSRPLHVDVIGVRVSRCPARVVANKGPRAAVGDTPDLAIPDHVVDARSCGAVNEGLKKLVPDQTLGWPVPPQTYIEGSTLGMGRRRTRTRNIPAHVDPKISYLREISADHPDRGTGRWLILIPVDGLCHIASRKQKPRT
jgi:hypothetical protein